MTANQQNELNIKIEAISRLLHLFQLERIIYVIVTLLSLLVLLSCAIYLLATKGSSDTAPVIGLFGSSGAITFTLGRLLRMWNDAMKILMPMAPKQLKTNNHEQPNRF
jgi:hypothetical protein